jgi:hypothetical protein
MRRSLLLAALAAALAIPAVTAASADAYLNQSTCQGALTGAGGTDNDAAAAAQFYWPNTWSFWRWGYFNRRSNNEVRQDIVFNSGNTTGLHELVFVCDDRNGSGAVAWDEDWYDHQWVY